MLLHCYIIFLGLGCIINAAPAPVPTNSFDQVGDLKYQLSPKIGKIGPQSVSGDFKRVTFGPGTNFYTRDPPDLSEVETEPDDDKSAMPPLNCYTPGIKKGPGNTRFKPVSLSKNYQTTLDLQDVPFPLISEETSKDWSGLGGPSYGYEDYNLSVGNLGSLPSSNFKSQTGNSMSKSANFLKVPEDKSKSNFNKLPSWKSQ